ncbi:MAG TPA: sigma factor, partial [Candidatus Dojkabacteria bacterium]|nr:sigma factor [Candidatus Dojkabacteria bacterium]
MYKTYLLKVYRYMYARVHNVELAQDLTSDCMWKVVRNQDFIDHKKNIGSWIFTIAHNTLIDYFRTN